MKPQTIKSVKKSYIQLSHLTNRIKYPRTVLSLVLKPVAGADGHLMSIDSVNEVRAILAVITLANIHTIREGQPVRRFETSRSEFLKCAGLPAKRYGERGQRIIQAARTLNQKKIITLTEVGKKLVIRVGPGFELSRNFVHLPPCFIELAKAKVTSATRIPTCFEKFLIFLVLYGNDRHGATQGTWDGSINEINFKKLARKIGIGHLAEHRKQKEMESLILNCAAMAKEADIVESWVVETCKDGKGKKIRLKLRSEYFSPKKRGPVPTKAIEKVSEVPAPASRGSRGDSNPPRRLSNSTVSSNYFTRNILPQMASALSGGSHVLSSQTSTPVPSPDPYSIQHCVEPVTASGSIPINQASTQRTPSTGKLTPLDSTQQLSGSYSGRKPLEFDGEKCPNLFEMALKEFPHE